MSYSRFRALPAPRAVAAAVFALSLLCCALAPTASAGVKVQVEGIQPKFRAGVSDYVIDPKSCGAKQKTRFRVSTPGAVRAKLGEKSLTAQQTRGVSLRPSQAIKLVVIRDRSRSSYFFRCLPQDFPDFEFARSGPTQSGLFAVDPYDAQAPRNYSIIFSDRGAPVWWRKVSPAALDSKVLPNGLLAYSVYHGGGFGQSPGSRYELVSPDGKLQSVLRVVGGPTDHHDLRLTADGNYLLVAYIPHAESVNATAYNEDADAQVIDAVIQKLSPAGELLWQWNGRDHIGLEETGRWWDSLEEPYDIHHINSVDEIEDGAGAPDLLISLRHTDAVYRLDGNTGAVVWKLGGTATPESLGVLGDPLGYEPLGGQHDARWLGNQTISVFDNGTNLNRAPRAVRYRINPAANTATLLGATEDPLAPRSGCCGSARWLGGGNWLVSWGGEPLVSELTAGGKRRLKLEFAKGFSYRAQPVGGALSVRELRRGMSAQVRPKR